MRRHLARSGKAIIPTGNRIEQLLIWRQSELERQQRLYELQRLYQDYEQGDLNDLTDDISEAASYQPAEHEVSPEFLLRGHELH